MCNVLLTATAGELRPKGLPGQGATFYFTLPKDKGF